MVAILEADAKRRTRDFDEARWHSHNLAALVILAYGGKMPEWKPSGEAVDNARQDEVDAIRVRGEFIRDALRAEKGRGGV